MPNSEQMTQHHPLIVAGGFAEIYDSASRDLASERGMAEPFGTEFRVFTPEEVDVGPVPGLSRYEFARLITEAIQDLDSGRPWIVPCLSHLLHYESAHRDQHKYPLFASGMVYTHGINRSDMQGMGNEGIPAVRKLEDGTYALSYHLLAGLGDTTSLEVLETSYFLAMR